jgi:hypothetical protein
MTDFHGVDGWLTPALSGRGAACWKLAAATGNGAAF